MSNTVDWWLWQILKTTNSKKMLSKRTRNDSTKSGCKKHGKTYRKHKRLQKHCRATRGAECWVDSRESETPFRWTGQFDHNKIDGIINQINPNLANLTPTLRWVNFSINGMISHFQPTTNITVFAINRTGLHNGYLTTRYSFCTFAVSIPWST